MFNTHVLYNPLLQTLNVTDRSHILNFNKEKKRNYGEDKPSFKPELNKRSQ